MAELISFSTTISKSGDLFISFMQSGAGRILTARPRHTNYFFFHRHAPGQKNGTGNMDNIPAINVDDITNGEQKIFTKM
ncbi:MULTISPECIES: hypothetical protein [Akkermansia]|uniref:hypothetical protein n=1 Tax=Akkermansia TaxID=239934 RepID=UPI001CA5CFE6|nr:MULTISPECIES: hypothetical protein [Akkermansia]